jgi:HK97 family phage portal protein
MNRLSKLRVASNVIKSGAGWDAIFLKNLQMPQGDDVLTDPYYKSDLVYVCISTTAKAIAQVPLVVVTKKGRDWIRVEDRDPLQQLLDKPNTVNPTAFDFINTIISQLLLTGHVFLLPFPPGSKKYTALWVIPKSNMEPVVTASTSQLEGWIYNPKRERKGIPLTVDEVASIKFFNPKDPFMGMAPIEAGKIPVRTEYKLGIYNEKFFDEGAVPGGILSSENRINDSQFERIVKQFEDKHKGFQQGHRLAILDNGLKFTQTGLSQKDMMFPELKKMNREAILQIFGMKKVVVSVTDDLNFATAKTERKEWWQGTNLPLMGMIETALTAVIFKNDLEHKIVFDISNVEALHEDFKDKVDTGDKLFKMGFAANEINARLELGFESKPWRNFWYVPSNTVKVLKDGTIEMIGVNPALQQPVNSPKPPEPEKPEEEEPEEEAAKPKAIEYKSGFTADEEEQAGSRWREIVGGSELIQWEFESKVRRVFFDMRKKTLKLLNVKAAKDVETEEFMEERRDLISFTVPIYERALRYGAGTLAQEIGVGLSFNLNDPQVIHYLTVTPLKLTGVIDTVKDDVRKQLIEGVTANETTQQIGDRFRGLFAGATKRAMTIANTEVGRALNYARSIEMQNAPYTTKIWFTALDERVRMTHRAMHGARVLIGQPWVLGSGVSLRFPGDPNGPARETINCRCIELIDTSTRTGV